MDQVLTALKSTQAKRFYWHTFNGALGLLIIILGDLNVAWTPLVIALLNGITKEINNNYLK